MNRKKTLILMWSLVAGGIVAVIVLIIGLVISIANWPQKEEVVVVTPESEASIMEKLGFTSGELVISVNGEEKSIRGLYIADGVDIDLSEGEYQTIQDYQAIFAVANGGKLTLENVTLNTSGVGAPSVIVASSGEVVIKNSTITTRGADTYSILVADGGKINVADSEIHTYGQNGTLVYTTGNATLSKVTGLASESRMIMIEASGVADIAECNFSGDGKGAQGNDAMSGILIYNSAETKTDDVASLKVDKSTLTLLNNSEMFSLTPLVLVANVNAKVEIVNSKISFSEDNNLIQIGGTSAWGEDGANGSIVQLVLSELDATNTVVVMDDLSNVGEI